MSFILFVFLIIVSFLYRDLEVPMSWNTDVTRYKSHEVESRNNSSTFDSGENGFVFACDKEPLALFLAQSFIK